MRLSRSALPNALLYLAAPLRSRPRSQPYKRVGIYKADRLGDFVLSLGAIKRLVEAYGLENCVLIGSRFCREMAQTELPGLEVVEVSCGHNQLWKTRAELRRFRGHPLFAAGVGDLVCLRHHRTLHDDTLIGAIPASQTWGVPSSPLTDAAEQLVRSRLVFDHTVTWPACETDECSELAAHRGVVGAFLRLHLAARDTMPTFARALDETTRHAVVSPFGSDSIRDLSTDQLEGVARAINKHGWEMRLLAEPRQLARYESLAEELGRRLPYRVDVVVTANITELIEAVSKARLVVAVETVTAHMAAAMDKPLVATVGGGHFGWFAPWRRSGRQQWVVHKTDCYGCNWHCHQTEPICLTRITARQLQDAVNLALSASTA